MCVNFYHSNPDKVMPKISVICKGFRGVYEHLNKTHDVEVPYWKFIVASLTVGFQRFGDLTSGGRRLLQHRLGLGMASIAYLGDENGSLRLDGSHVALDGSEKGTVSYWQGMVLAKIVAAEILGVRWLQHADAMERRGDLIRRPAKQPRRTAKGKKRGKRADMAGKDDQNGWHVFEAKGFSSHPGKKAFRDAKDQAGMVKTIENDTPMTTSACISCLWKSPIEVIVDDPPVSGFEDWTIPNEGFWNSYYGAIADHIRKSEFVEEDEGYPGFVFAPVVEAFRDEIFHLPLFDVRKIPSIGLPKTLLDDPSRAPKVIPELFESGDRYHIANDGVAVRGNLGEFTRYSERP